MRQRRALPRVAFWATTLSACTLAFTADVEGEFVSPGAPEKLYAHNASSVVSVRIAVQRLNDRGKFENDLFAVSGFFVSDSGYVLTFSETSIKGARIWVEKDGVSNLAEPIGWDPRTKIALLQLVRLPAEIDFVPIPTAAERLPIGSIVMGISSPYGLSPSPSLGMVTGYESAFAEYEFPFSYLRTNIPIGPGELGFPVLGMDGQLVGMSVASIPEARSSYIVPSKALSRIVDDFTAHGRVEYGTLPVGFRESEDASNATIQVVVSEVRPGSSAARAGLRPGDIVRRIGSMPVRRMHDVRDALFFSGPGEYLTIEIDRDGRPLDWALPVEAARTEPDSESTDGPSSGSPDLSTNKPLPPGSQFVPTDREPRLDLPRDFDPETN